MPRMPTRMPTRLKNIINRHDTGISYDAERIMEAVNREIEGYGVVPIENEDGRIVAYYVNAGETYKPTFLYDVVKARFYWEIGGFGSFVEAKQKAYRIK